MGLNAFKDQIVILFSCSGSWGKESFLFSPFELANLKAQFTSATNRAYDILMKTKNILDILMVK